MNNDNDLLVKDDINFLEYPIWIVQERENSQEFTIKKEKGLYTISTSLTLPKRFDKIILYYLLSELFNTTQPESSQIKTTRYKIAKNTFYKTKNIGKTHYDRIMLSLKRWSSIFVEFEGIFYEGDTYTNRGFHIIDGYKLDDKGTLYVDVNKQYLEQIKNSNYFKLIDFNEYKKLKKPSSNRLYEILIKTFKDREIWQIHIIKLGEKLTLSEKYPSQIYRIVLSAVNEIIRNTNLQVKLEYNEKTHICTFMKLQNAQEEKQKEPNSLNIPEDNNLNALISILPKEHQDKKTILEAMSKAFKNHGYDYVKRNIEYTNKNCKTNYRSYLNKALKEDFGLGLQEDYEAKQKQSESDKMLQKEYDTCILKKVEKYKKDNLSEEELNNLYQRISQYYERDNNPLTKEAVIKKTNYFLAQQIGLPSFDEWKKHYNC